MDASASVEEDELEIGSDRRFDYALKTIGSFDAAGGHIEIRNTLWDESIRICQKLIYLFYFVMFCFRWNRSDLILTAIIPTLVRCCDSSAILLHQVRC